MNEQARPIDVQPGVAYDVPLHEYLRWDAAGHTALEAIFSHCPARCRRKARRVSLSAARRTGMGVSVCALEPHLLLDAFVICPTGADGRRLPRRSKEQKARWSAFEAQHADKTIITPAEYAAQKRARAALLAHEVAAALFRDSRKQVGLVWEDRGTGCLCKARVNLLIDTTALRGQLPGGRALGILKTVRPGEANPARGRFGRVMWRWGYHRQAALYRDGWAELTGEDLPVLFVLVEKDELSLVAVHRASRGAMAVGRGEVAESLRAYCRCRSRGEWPGYGGGIHVADLPAWAVPWAGVEGVGAGGAAGRG